MILGSRAASSGAGPIRHLRAWWLASSLVLSAAVSRAGPIAGDAQRAERLFNEGRMAMAEESFDVACAAFAESQKLDPAAGTLVNWGACLEAQGKLASALDAYRASVASTEPGTDPERQRFVEERIAQLEPRLCHVAVAISASAPAGILVKLDDKALDASHLNAPTPVDRGLHRVEISAPGFRSWSEAFTLDADGSNRVIEVPALERESSLPPTPAASTPAPPQPAAPTRTTSTTALVVELAVTGGVAAAGAVGTLSFGFLAASAWDERRSHCPAHRCDDIAVAASVRAEDWARAANIAAAVTGTALGLGLYFVLSHEHGTAAPHSSIVVRSARDGAQVQWRGDF
jgi:hypothetical protein